jgi:hypothetical protein
MVRKLTLSLDKGVIATAKKLAQDNNTSVSAMFSRFIQSMAAEPWRAMPIGPLMRKATGIMKLPAGKDYKEVLTDALMEKYGIPNRRQRRRNSSA